MHTLGPPGRGLAFIWASLNCLLGAALGSPALLSVIESGPMGFTRLAPEQTGVLFTNHLLLDRQLTNQILLNGAGVAAGDIDGDGWCDLYFCALDNRNRLYRNLGQWKFEDVTEISGTSCEGIDCTGAALADLDGDGDLDLIVNSMGGGTRVFLNSGSGRFTLNPQQQTLNARRAGCSMALGDVDGDGDLDIYIANYRLVTIRDQPNTRFTMRSIEGTPSVVAVNGIPINHPDLVERFIFSPTLTPQGGKFSYTENGEPDALLLNDGFGLFTEVPLTGGNFLDQEGAPLSKAPPDWGLSVMMRDFNQDGAPDIFVCNDFLSPDRLWLNDGRGHFRPAPALALRHLSLSSMGVDVADIDRDGHDDIFTVDMLSQDQRRRLVQKTDLKAEESPLGAIDNVPQSAHNALFWNRGNGTYAEIAQLSGLEAADWAWTPAFLDVDLDGYEDLLISNGFPRDNMNMDMMQKLALLKSQQTLTPIEQLRLRAMIPPLETANAAFRNLGNLRFKDNSQAWGFDERAISQGLALADLDNDGDLDVVLNNLNSAASLYRNNCPKSRVAVRLRGLAPNTQGIGARILVFGGPVPLQTQEMISGGRYLSSDQPLRAFAAGAGPMRVEVEWRSGRRTVLNDVKANQIYDVAESATPPEAPPPAPSPSPLFVDATHLLNHVHHEEPFDDWDRQPLLPKRLSRLGPGVAWADLDGDGWDDLLVSAGRGGMLAALRNEQGKGFRALAQPSFMTPVDRDQTTVLFHATAQEKCLIAGAANYEDGSSRGGAAQKYPLREGQALDIVATSSSSTGPLALADIDGDGDLDLFVGGRSIASAYPVAATSHLFRWTGERFELAQTFPNVGLVCGALFSDLDNDGDPDLLMACEWGPIRLFTNDRGQFTDATGSWGLRPFQGLWQGVSVGDFDEDGRLDIVASNWGRNSIYERFMERPVSLYYADFDRNGTVDCVEAVRQQERLVALRDLSWLSKGLPFLSASHFTHQAFADSNLQDALDAHFSHANCVQINWLDSSLFLNKGGHFQCHPLPNLAQFAPAFAVNIADYDGDGHDDVFLSQNFFGLPAEMSRQDAGCGLVLLGDGQGGLRCLSPRESGLEIYGEQRGAAVGDYDRDGRVDLAVSQNANATRLFRNVRAKPGVRILLHGLPENPAGIGATLRIRGGREMGPLREIHAGSGYWSQDSSVQILHPGSLPAELTVRWPGGAISSHPIPKEATELTLTHPSR